jgi:hypothetical protein
MTLDASALTLKESTNKALARLGLIPGRASVFLEKQIQLA